mgnify:CR=1 FL=1|tara:strand:+ start:236 stop:664 length:429 start_codon:yes stop_codon:yes gene_type:complete
MDKKYYIDKGFELYAFMIPSDKYTQGIEIMYPSNPIKSDNQPAVYILTDVHGKVLKIGETQNLTSRFYRGYRCISNTTNDRIRQHIKDVDNIWVYVLPLPIVKEKILGYKCETSYVKGLEYNLLKEYKDKKGAVPPLNVFIK